MRVLNNKTRYNQLELTSGRMAAVNQGDVVVGALGCPNLDLGIDPDAGPELQAGDRVYTR